MRCSEFLRRRSESFMRFVHRLGAPPGRWACQVLEQWYLMPSSEGVFARVLLTIDGPNKWA